MIRRMTGADRTRMSRAMLAVHIDRLRDREASLVTVRDVAAEQLVRLRVEIDRADVLHVKRGSNETR